MPEHNQDLRAGRRRLFVGNKLGQHSVLGVRSCQAVFCLETMLDAWQMQPLPKQSHAVVYAHLVPGLEVFRVLQGRSMQLLHNRTLYKVTYRHIGKFLILLFQSASRNINMSYLMVPVGIGAYLLGNIINR